VIYILHVMPGFHYAGYTSNPARRLRWHREGRTGVLRYLAPHADPSQVTYGMLMKAT
jgi:predicted GIY-YIG superfamily endonuclease